MNEVTEEDLKKLYLPPRESHKGQNGRLLIIGGSELFHAASIWSLTVASRIVDLVHYCSVPENNEIILQLKTEFRNGIVVPRSEVESYIEEDDCILIGPGMVRTEGLGVKSEQLTVNSLEEINSIRDEGEQTYALTTYLLKKYPQKQWVIDAGALQMLELNTIPPHAILTPHQGEFEGLWEKYRAERKELRDEDGLSERALLFAKDYNCIVLVKGVEDVACSTNECRSIGGGNAGMTKGGTGDVLAGLIAALACKNDPFLATIAGSLLNKKAGDELYQTVGPFFNATDLANQIPKTMKEILI